MKGVRTAYAEIARSGLTRPDKKTAPARDLPGDPRFCHRIALDRAWAFRLCYINEEKEDELKN